MSADPTEPDSFRDQPPDAFDDEAPEADAAEQLAELTPRGDDPLSERDRDGSAEADAAEQARVVSLDEDDYR
ncbi:hypothetical protein [Streptomyces sp. NPDC097619]|uniref:hypothetical protein n=1 Tax=Streptomyces sp. NPDC097619 TaxID=3157228 RepID=UPI00332C7446